MNPDSSEDNKLIINMKRNKSPNIQIPEKFSSTLPKSNRKTPKGITVINSGRKLTSFPQHQNISEIQKQAKGTRDLKKRFLASKNKNLKFHSGKKSKKIKSDKTKSKEVNSDMKKPVYEFSQKSLTDPNSILTGSVQQSYNIKNIEEIHPITQDLRISNHSYASIKRGNVVRGAMKVKQVKKEDENEKILKGIDIERTKGDNLWQKIQDEFLKMGIMDRTLYEEIMESSDRLVKDKDQKGGENEDEESDDSEELQMPEIMNLEGEIKKLQEIMSKMDVNMERKTQNIRILKVIFYFIFRVLLKIMGIRKF